MAEGVAEFDDCLTFETIRDIGDMRGVRDPSQEFARYIAEKRAVDREKHAVDRRPLVLDAADPGGLSQRETPTVSE